MVSAIILILIYISFISLGLPDSLLGASWPLMHLDMGADLSLLGFVYMTISIGTILSALSYAKVSRIIKPGKLNCISTLVTALALWLISNVQSFALIFPIALLLGLGAGAVDASLNNYVALHYKARQMSFLHACWGIGTIFGPTLLSFLFAEGRSWRGAYSRVSSIQLGIFLLLFLTLPLWKKAEKDQYEGSLESEEKPKTHDLGAMLKKKGVKTMLLSTFLYCSVEAVTFIWTASFVTESIGLSKSDAAFIVSMLYWGITMGRIVTGFFNDRLGDDAVIITGLAFTLLASFGFLFFRTKAMLVIAAFFIGFGFGPVFPSLLHQTPSLFGIEDSSAIIGMEMAAAYFGSAAMPVVFGLGTKLLTPGYLPWMLLLFTGLEILAWTLRKKVFIGK